MAAKHSSVRSKETEGTSEETRALESEERYQAFIQNSHEGIWRVEVDEPISVDLPPARQIDLMYERAYMAEANNAMAAMYGADSVDDLIGVRLKDLLIRDDPRNTAYLEAFIASGYALSGVDSHEVDQQGDEKVFRNSLVGVIKDGLLLRAWGTQQDITMQYRAEAALRKSQEHLALALTASRMGTWEWDIKTNELLWSDELKMLFGLVPEEAITYERYQAALHPDERAKILRNLNTAMTTGMEYRMRHRIVWPDGSIHWVLGQGRALLEDGRPVRMIGTCMNIDDIKHGEELAEANAKLTLKQEQLVALNKSKDEFISLASHQLRTPVSIVKQYVGILLQGYCDDLTPRQQEFLQIAYDNNERGLQVINDLLKVARVDAGKVVLATSKIDLTQLLIDIVKEQASMFALRSQQLQLRRSRQHVYVIADALRLRMVIENLLDNAFKYSPKGRTTTIQLQGNTKTIRIAIEDQGVGIAKRDIAKLFQKFSRIDNSLSMIVGGTGIGLYWAKKIIDLHGGTIAVTSKRRQGSTFTILLPAI